VRRLTGVLALLAVLAWTCLLFGIGLDDLTNDHTRPGVIFSVVVLPLLIGLALYAIVRLARPSRRSQRSR
jgi:hypothetical protein